MELQDCYFKCQDDEACKRKCIRDYDYTLFNCPCRGGCLNGCPCPVFDCELSTTQSTTSTISLTTSSTTTPSVTTTVQTTTTTTPLSTSVLVLKDSKDPFITNADGLVLNTGSDFTFSYEDYLFHQACSLTWQGEFFIFGGFGSRNSREQILKISGCKLEQIGSLEFKHDYGGCANVDDRLVYLCFGSSSEQKICRVATDPLGQFDEIEESFYAHNETRIGASKG